MRKGVICVEGGFAGTKLNVRFDCCPRTLMDAILQIDQLIAALTDWREKTLAEIRQCMGRRAIDFFETANAAKNQASWN